MKNIKDDERLNKLNHSCAHLLAQAVKHLYNNAKFWVGPVIEEGFYYDIDLGDITLTDKLSKRVKSENITDFEYLKEVIVDELLMIYVGNDILTSKTAGPLESKVV